MTGRSTNGERRLLTADAEAIPRDGLEEGRSGVVHRRRDRLVVALTLSSGAVDAICYLGLGKVFSAFMTGNLVFLGVRLAGGPVVALPCVATALVAFVLGVHVATLLVNPTRGSAV